MYVWICVATEEERFFIGQVTDNNFHSSTMQVRWFHPTERSKLKYKNHYHKMSYTLELVPVPQRGRQNGAARYRMEERHDELRYSQVRFS